MHPGKSPAFFYQQQSVCSQCPLGAVQPELVALEDAARWRREMSSSHLHLPAGSSRSTVRSEGKVSICCHLFFFIRSLPTTGAGPEGFQLHTVGFWPLNAHLWAGGWYIQAHHSQLKASTGAFRPRKAQMYKMKDMLLMICFYLFSKTSVKEFKVWIHSQPCTEVDRVRSVLCLAGFPYPAIQHGICNHLTEGSVCLVV